MPHWITTESSKISQRRRPASMGAARAAVARGAKRWGRRCASHPAAARMQINPGYETLIEPDGPIIFAGDHVSHIVAWQEGAALSALRAVAQVNDKVKAARLAGGVS